MHECVAFFLPTLAAVWRPLAMAGAWRLVAGIGWLALLAGATLLNVSYEEGGAWTDARVQRDYSGTVIAYGERLDKHLLVNGVGMTVMLPVTKVMAHLSLAVHGEARSLLVICFGMGTTHRAALSWGVEATAVEL